MEDISEDLDHVSGQPNKKLASEIAAEGQRKYDIDLTLFNTDESPKFDFSKLSPHRNRCRQNDIQALTLKNKKR